MIQPSSRYYPIETAHYQTADGRTLAYVRRRFLPRPDSLPLLAEVTVTQGDRLDLICARTLGDPEQFWRICDASGAVDPFELTAEPGRRLRVPVPQP
jgi:hypothetical protein